MVRIREAEDRDAAALFNLMPRLDAETNFLLYEAGERTTSLVEWQQRLADNKASGNSVTLIAEVDGKPVGTLGAAGGRVRRNRHTAHIGVAILQEHVGRGIGTRLFEELERWARAHDVSRLELTVMVNNEAAINLYKKLGFETEGLRRRSLRVDGRWVDEFAMAKLLD